MTLDEFCDNKPDYQHIEKFRTAYRKGMERDALTVSYDFPPIGDEAHWLNEHGLFLDVGGDADDPIE